MQPDYRSPLQTGQRPPHSRGRLLKRPQPFHVPDETAGGGSNRQYELDIAQMPTRKQRRVMLTPEELRPFEQLDEQLAAGLDLSSMGTMRLMQLSGMLRAVRMPEMRTPPGPVSSNGNTPATWEMWPGGSTTQTAQGWP